MHRASRLSTGWRVLLAYASVCASTQVLWLTYAAITTETADRYGVSVGAVGWLAEIFPLLYVVLALPAGALLDRWFRPALAASGGLVATGAVVRLGGETFAWALAGQTLVAIAQPVVLSAISKLAGQYLPVEQRAAGIAVASGAGFVGMLLALLLGPTVGAHGDLERLLVLEAAIGVTTGLALALAMLAPGHARDEHAAIEGNAARALWSLPIMRVLCRLVFVGFGIFIALATWLQTLVHPSGISEATAGGLLVGMVAAGTIGCAVIPHAVARRHAEGKFMLAVVAIAFLGCVVLAGAPGLGVRAFVLVLMGATLLPALPVVLSSIERLAGAAAGTAGAIIWLAGNVGGVVVALLVQVLVHDPSAAFLALAAVALFGVPAAARLRRLMPAPSHEGAAAGGRPRVI
jgi:predicted MFS family arabinose efflux permease